MYKEHDVVILTDDYSKRNLPAGSKGTIIYAYPGGTVFEVEFITTAPSTVLTLKDYQFKKGDSL